MKKEEWVGINEQYIHYLYKIVNKTNGKYYYGIHSVPKDLGKTPENDGYWGSGTAITKAIREEGRENFTKEIVKLFSTREELIAAEKEIVTMKEVVNSKCYNLILGGDSNTSHLGWIICRPKAAIDKVIKISREEYYQNKDEYVLTGHLSFYETGHGTSRLKDGTNKRKKRHENRALGNYSRRVEYINKDTLESKTYIGREVPNNLYYIWFPHYFLDKVHKKFIDESYFKESYEKFSNLADLAKYFGIGKRTTKSLKNYYVNSGLILSERTTTGKTKTRGFTGKAFVNKEGITRVINISELDKYIDDGWKRGKAVYLPDKECLVTEFVNHPSFKILEKKV